MPKLKNTKIYRGGSTSNTYKYETDDCLCYVQPSDSDNNPNSLNLHFSLASKGGGITDVKVTIGKDDLPIILTEIVRYMPKSREAFLDSAKIIAEKNPESLTTFLECATIANQGKIEQKKKNAEKLKTLKESITESLTELESVDEFVSEIYRQLPHGEDEQEKIIMDKTQKVVASLSAMLEQLK
jgi:hypothetical protein